MKTHRLMAACLLTVCLLVTLEAWALTCYVTVVKDTCWRGYDVDITVRTGLTNQSITQIRIPQGQDYGRQTFSCKALDNFYYEAHFSPTIWQGQEQVLYRSKNYTIIPEDLPKNYLLWEIKTCFPADFAQVPIPPKIAGNCHCDYSKIPPVTRPLI